MTSTVEPPTPPLNAPDGDAPSSQIEAEAFGLLRDCNWTRYYEYWLETWGKPAGLVVGGIGLGRLVNAWDELYRSYEHNERWAARSACIGYGQTGIGNSVCLHYLLARCMEKKIPVVFGYSDTSSGTTLICDKGVFSVPTNDIDCLEFLQKPIFLVDSKRRCATFINYNLWSRSEMWQYLIVAARLELNPDVQKIKCYLSEIRPHRSGLARSSQLARGVGLTDLDAARMGLIPDDVARYWDAKARRHKQYDPFATFEALGAGIRRIVHGVHNETGDIIKDALGPINVKGFIPNLQDFHTAVRRGDVRYEWEQVLVQQPEGLLSNWPNCVHVFPTPSIRKIFVDGLLAHDGPLDHVMDTITRVPQVYGPCYDALVLEHLSCWGAHVNVFRASGASPPLILPPGLPLLHVEPHCGIPLNCDYVALLDPDFPSFDSFVFLASQQTIVFLRVSIWNRAHKGLGDGFDLIQKALGDQWSRYKKAFVFVEPELDTAERWARSWHDRITKPDDPQVKVDYKQPPPWMYQCTLGALGVGKVELAVNVAKKPVGGDGDDSLLVVKAEEPIQLSQLLTKPAHSIINQASDSRLRLDAGSINADGFGVGWYPTDEAPDSPGPCVFRSITPAWSNLNLHRLADKIKSCLVFAHVRASTTGALSEENTGCISDFAKIKRRLQNDLSDEYFQVPQGNTDSEWAFAAFLQQLSKLTDPKKATIPHAILRQAMLNTVAVLTAYTKDVGATEPSLMNFCVSDGTSVVATRYITSANEEAASLFFSTGSTFQEVEPGTFKMNKADKRERIVLIACVAGILVIQILTDVRPPCRSEPLTFERADWVEIPSQSCIVITPRINLLRYPIVNEFFQPSATSHRADGFARAKGYRAARATVAEDPPNPLPFPTKSNPSPFEIFHFAPNKALTAKEIKGRYLELVKLYHPDRRAAAAVASSSSSSRKGKGRAKDDDHEFKQIVAAYELLSDPNRRAAYLRSGFGWGATAGAKTSASPWSSSSPEYSFRRGRPMSSSARYAGTYDHWTWTDPYNPHFRPEDNPFYTSYRDGMAANGRAAGWEGQGVFGKNGFVFLALASFTLFMTPLSAWYAVPSVPDGVDAFAPGDDGKRLSETGKSSNGWMPMVYDKKHQDAAANLQRARLEAQTRGHENREAIRKRVQQMKREEAFDRAQELQAIERGQSGTGHLALPAPPGM
ncbi:glucosamine 6-phosphate synthetase [Rhodotorula toruloides]